MCVKRKRERENNKDLNNTRSIPFASKQRKLTKVKVATPATESQEQKCSVRRNGSGRARKGKTIVRKYAMLVVR